MSPEQTVSPKKAAAAQPSPATTSEHTCGGPPPVVNATFVLVPGAWLGAWSWEAVAQQLRLAAVSSRAVQLPGLDDDLAGSFATHSAAVEQAVGSGTSPVVLVGHSHGGSLVTEVTHRAAGRVAGVIFLDGAMPRSGESTVDTWPDDLRAELVAGVDHDGRLPPPSNGLTGLPIPTQERLRPHPWEAIAHPVQRGVEVITTPVAFVRSSSSMSPYEEARRMVDRLGGYTDVIDGGHYPMLTNPNGTTDCLLAAADHLLGRPS